MIKMTVIVARVCLLQQSVDNGHLLQLVCCENSTATWDKLIMICELDVVGNVCMLQRQMNILTLQEGDNNVEFIAHAEKIAKELSSLREKPKGAIVMAKIFFPHYLRVMRLF